MKRRNWKSMFWVALLPALALAGTAYLMPARGVRAEKPEGPGKSESQARKLEGTWRVQVTLRDCQTGAELRPPAPALLTFAKGGTLTETTTVFPPRCAAPATASGGTRADRHTPRCPRPSSSTRAPRLPPPGSGRSGSRRRSRSGTTRTN